MYAEVSIYLSIFWLLPLSIHNLSNIYVYIYKYIYILYLCLYIYIYVIYKYISQNERDTEQTMKL